MSYRRSVPNLQHLLLLLLLVLHSVSVSATASASTCPDPLQSQSQSHCQATATATATATPTATAPAPATSPSSIMSTTATTAVRRMPVIFMSHFGGPNFYLDHRIHGAAMKGHDTNSAYAHTIRGMRQKYGWVEGGKYGKPRALLVVSAHWITSGQVKITGQEHYKTLFYDYGGFGIDNKDVTYPAPGDKQVSQQVLSLLNKAGIAASIDDKRNFDHGVYNILHVLFPDADIPVIQVSILSHYDPQAHLALGESLSSLRDTGILIIGSGEVTHNFAPTRRGHNLQFSESLRRVLEDEKMTAEQRYKQLREWEKLPNARIAHAEEDHFVPLHVIVGAAKGAPAQRILEADMAFMDKHFVADSYLFE